MSFRGNNKFGNRDRGGSRGGGGRGGFGGGGRGGFGGGGRGGFGGGGRNFDQGPPEHVIPLGHYEKSVQDDLVCKVEIEDVPYFNAPIYLENKNQIGKIDEIFGNIRNYWVSIRLSEDVKASSFNENQKLYIDPSKLLPLQRFLPSAGGNKKRGGGGRGGNRGGGRGGRGSFGNRGRGGFGGGDRRGGGGDRSFGGGGGFKRNSSGGNFNRNSGGFGRGGGGGGGKRW